MAILGSVKIDAFVCFGHVERESVGIFSFNFHIQKNGHSW